MAIEPAMGAIKCIAGLRIVVEAPTRPAVRIVAEHAIAPEATLVVLVLVAARASARRILKLRRPMAVFAWHDRMASDQRETRDIVIEGHFLTPAGFPVALLTSIAELTLVRIVLLMTGHASGRELIAIEIAGMAGIAFYLCVFAAQRKLCHFVMVETHRPPFGRSMASLALGAIAAGMGVLQTMAGGTIHRQIFIAFASVASRAGHIFVGAL